ncbi:MAG: hypothetical protein JOZ40_23065 [Methylobacteriaceae bacterium]|nr:hypothetical protein [Methylobacteriaceae bacterium]
MKARPRRHGTARPAEAPGPRARVLGPVETRLQAELALGLEAAVSPEKEARGRLVSTDVDPGARPARRADGTAHRK